MTEDKNPWGDTKADATKADATKGKTTPKLVTLVREPCGNRATTAEVPAEEVANYLAGGWHQPVKE